MNRSMQNLALCATLLLPAWLYAQVLDFDAVCSTPPCALSTQYSPSGIVFVANLTTQAQIVTAGTDGLTGTNGGHYVRVTQAPTQLVINLSRNATFFSMQASRATSSSESITLSVSFFKLGVQVGSTALVTLANVNTWATVTFQDAGGFDSVLLDPGGGVNNTFGIDNLQFGGRCNGFADVQTTDSFCDATEWLANRSVTLGCVAGSYCPIDNVTRAQMALFMRRLGDALTPTYLESTDIVPIGAFTTPVVACRTSDFVITGFPRTFTGIAAVQAYQATAAKTMRAQTVYSLNGGSDWNPVTFWFASTTQPTEFSAWSVLLPPLTFFPGTSIRFGVRLEDMGAAPGVSVGMDCHLRVNIVSTKGATAAPFDTGTTSNESRRVN